MSNAEEESSKASTDSVLHLFHVDYVHESLAPFNVQNKWIVSLG